MKQMPNSTLEALVCILSISAERMKEIENILCLNLGNENYVYSLKEKYEYLDEAYQGKYKEYSNNDNFFQYSDEKADFIMGIEDEIGLIKAELKMIHEENEEMAKNKEAIRENKVSYIKRVKVFHQLSENALRLRSKLLLKHELLKNIKSAEVELEFLMKKTNKKKTKQEALSEKNEENIKFAAKEEADLYETRKKQKKLEIRIEGLFVEKQELLTPPDSDNHDNFFKSKGEEKTEIIQLSTLISGFSEMKKEKESLIIENNKLKERISKLFQIRAS